MTYSTLALSCMFIAGQLHAMQPYLAQLIDTSQEETQSNVPSLYSLSVVALTKALLLDDSEEVLTLAEKIQNGGFSHFWNQDDVIRVLRRDMLLYLAELCKNTAKMRTLAHEGSDRELHYINALAISPDGTQLAVSSSQVTIWDISDIDDIKDPKILKGPTLRGTEAGIRWTEDGTQLLLYKAGCLLCWDVASWKLLYRQQLSSTYDGFVSYQTKATFSADGKYLLCSQQGRVLDMDERPECSKGTCVPHKDIKGILLNLKDLETYRNQEHIDEQADEEIEIPHSVISCHTLSWQQGSSKVGRRMYVAFSPDNTYAVTAGADNTVRLCELDKLPQIKSRVFKHDGIVCTLAFSPDSKWLVTVSKEVEVDEKKSKWCNSSHLFVLYLWNVLAGTSEKLETFYIAKERRRYFDRGFPFEINFDGRFVVVQINNSDRYSARLMYDIERRTYTLPPFEDIIRESCTCFSPDMRYLLIADGYKSTDLRIIPLLGTAEKLTLKELLLLAKLRSKKLKNDLNAEALKLCARLKKNGSSSNKEKRIGSSK